MIDEADAECLKEGENTTFINWGNLTIQKINKENGKIKSVNAKTDLGNTDFKKTVKVTWLAKVEDEPSAAFTPTTCVYYDHIISKPVLQPNDDFKDFIGKETKTEIEMEGDPELRNLKKGDIIQLQRRGFFIVDAAYKPPSVHTGRPCAVRLIAIPDGTPDSYGPPSKKGAKTNAAQTLEEKKKEKKDKAAAGGGKKATSQPAGSGPEADKLNDEITNQGNVVRKLKTEKAGKSDIDAAVKTLLELKTKYKEKTGKDWKPGEHEKLKKESSPAAAVSNKAPTSSQSNDADKINEDIVKQGNEVRDLKSNKADKAAVDAAVKVLLDLKGKYKEATGKDWKPGKHVNASSPSSQGSNADKINEDIVKQGNEVRDLKSNKADKATVDAAVKLLLDLKGKYKEATGKDWKPGQHVNASSPSSQGSSGDAEKLDNEITEQGNKVRDLKGKKAEKSEIDKAVAVLLDLKEKYKQATGNAWKPGSKPEPKS